MPELIERDALKNHLYRAQAEAFKRSEWYVAGAIQSFIDILDKQPTIPDIDRAEILRLCNEIEDIVNEIAACAEIIDYSTHKVITDKLKEIGKELNGDAGTDRT